jgi:hypothetical protein
MCCARTSSLACWRPSYYIRWKSSPLYKLVAFSHPMFLSFVDKMRVAQDTEAAHQIAIPGLIRNEVERVVTEKVCLPLHQTHATLTAILLQLKELQQRQD